VVITHPHRDHIDDIFNFDLLTPQVLWRPKHLSDAEIRKANRDADMPLIKQYMEINQRFNLPVAASNDLTVPGSFGGATFQVFSPRFCDTSNINNHSLVVAVSYAGLKMVLPGDNEAPSWKELLNDSAFVAAVKGVDVLLASHHGRNAGYCAELFEAMGEPKLVVVSDGRFGDTSATDRYSKQASGWTVFDAAGSNETRKCLTTRSDGHITIKFDWSSDPEYINSLNVTTSRVNMSRLIARSLGI